MGSEITGHSSFFSAALKCSSLDSTYFRETHLLLTRAITLPIKGKNQQDSSLFILVPLSFLTIDPRAQGCVHSLLIRAKRRRQITQCRTAFRDQERMNSNIPTKARDQAGEQVRGVGGGLFSVLPWIVMCKRFYK